MAKQNFACPQKLCFLPMKSQCSERYHTPHAYLCQKIEHCPWGIYPLIHLLTSCKWHENCMSFRTMFWYILIYVLIYLPYPFFILPHLHVVKCYLPQGGDVDSQNQRQKTRVLPAFPYLETLTMRKMETTHSLRKHLTETIMNKIYLLPGLGVQRRKWVGEHRP